MPTVNALRYLTSQQHFAPDCFIYLSFFNQKKKRSSFTEAPRDQSVVSNLISGVWRYFMIYSGPDTHTHFVQTAEHSRVAVRRPSPQRTSLAAISKYAHISNPTTMQPVHGQFAFFFAGNWPQRKSCKEFVAQKALSTSLPTAGALIPSRRTFCFCSLSKFRLSVCLMTY